MVKVINAGDARYLAELPEFQDGLPHGIVNKTKTDVGGTYVATNCRSNYIIVCPFRDLVDSIAADRNNKYEVFKCYGGVREHQYKKYIKEHQIYKIAVTYDSFPKLIRWMNNKTDGWNLLVDEYHLILEDMDFRETAICGLLSEISKFKHYTFLSATPIDEDYEIEFFQRLPHYLVEWNNTLPVTVIKRKASSLTRGLCNLINIFLKEGFQIPDIDGEIREVEQLFVFLNSVTTIRQIVGTLELDASEVKICCANKQKNRLILGEYEIEPVINLNKRINFFTKKCFQGCNLFSNNGLIIVASDAYRTQTLVDISTTMEQISGRLRYNDEYQNVFRNTMIHLYSTNKNVLSDEEFEALMIWKEEEAARLLSLQEKANEEERKALIKRVNVETDLLSKEDGFLVRNEMKRKSFIRKQEIRKAYRDGDGLRTYYNKSQKFVQPKQELWDDFEGLLEKAVTVSYEKLLKDYLKHPSNEYEEEYPEFKDFRLYLKESEMNTCRWNKDKMMKIVEDKKKLQQVFRSIYHRGEFVSNEQLKKKLAEQFKRLGIGLTPKATLILSCDIY